MAWYVKLYWKLSKLAVACVSWKHQALPTLTAAIRQGKEFWVLLLPSLSPYSMSKNIPCGNTPPCRPAGPDPFPSNLNSSRSSFLQPLAPGLGSPYLATDCLWGWPPPRGPYPRLYSCSVLKNTTRPNTRKTVTGHKHSRQQSWQRTGSNIRYQGTPPPPPPSRRD